MQQQIQQHQRQLYQALLMKQQQQLPSHSSSSSSAGLHPPGGPVSSKSILDPFTGPHQASGLADSLHTKEPPSSPNAYNTYPLCKAAHHQCCALAIILKAIIINSKNLISMFKQQLKTAITKRHFHCYMCLHLVCVNSWTESKHECKLHGGWRFVPEGTLSAPVPPVPVDTFQLHGQPVWQLLKPGKQPQ